MAPGGPGAWRRAAGTAPTDKSPFSSASGRGEVPAPGSTSLGAAEPNCAPAALPAAVPGGPMPRCPTGAMDEGPVDLRTRPKAARLPGVPLPLRKRPLRAPSPEPAVPRCTAGPFVTPDPLLGGSHTPAVPAPPHGLARPEALYYQGECLSLVKVGLGASQGTGSPEPGCRAQRQVQGAGGAEGTGGKPKSQNPRRALLGRWGGGRP